MNVGAEARGFVAGILALEVDEAVDGVEATGALVCVASSLDEGKDGLVDVDTSGVLGAGVIVVVIVEYFLGEFCKGECQCLVSLTGSIGSARRESGLCLFRH